MKKERKKKQKNLRDTQTKTTRREKFSSKCDFTPFMAPLIVHVRRLCVCRLNGISSFECNRLLFVARKSTIHVIPMAHHTGVEGGGAMCVNEKKRLYLKLVKLFNYSLKQNEGFTFPRAKMPLSVGLG